MPNANTVRIVITGGPASGKTEFFERLKSEPPLSGFVFFEELARRILSDQPAMRHHTAEFHREIYRRQVDREKAAGERPFVTDRGTVDAFAFHPETMADVGTTIEFEYARYTGVIQLGSAASLGDAFYQRDNIRREDTAEALEIERAIRAVWANHPQYRFVAASENMEKKYDRFLSLIVHDFKV